MSRDKNGFVFLRENERDLPLSGCWKLQNPMDLAHFGIDACHDRKGTLSMIIAASLVASQYGLWVSYSRNRNTYSGQQRYHGRWFTYESVMAAVEHLINLGLIDEERQRRNGLGCQSRFRPTDKLAAFTRSTPVKHTVHELIQLKSLEKERINYDDNDLTRAMRKEMREVNESIREIRIESINTGMVASEDSSAEAKLVLPQQRDLYRCFIRGTWFSGGRLYGGFYQNLPKRYRRELLLDGSEVDEPDYAQLHPRLLYAECGLKLKREAYEIDGFSRDVSKLAWQLMLNCSSREGAIRALLKEVGRKNSKFKMQATRNHATKLISKLEQHHKAIENVLYTCAAPRLQYRDSELLLKVLASMRGLGLAGLPVHDSVICKKSEAAIVRDVMAGQLEELISELIRAHNTPTERRTQSERKAGSYI
jgi:hypothetical protein